TNHANQLLAGTTAFGFVLLGLLGWIAVIHPKRHDFEPIFVPESVEEHKIVFLFEPGWPQCDLRNFARVLGDNRARWFSGAIPDDNYRSAGIREISGRGYLYFGFDATTRDWKIIHTDQPVGLLSEVEIGARSHEGSRDNKYQDFYSAKNVQVIGAAATR